MTDWYIDWPALIVCAVAIASYAAVLTFFFVRIAKAKKALSGTGNIPRPPASYKTALTVSAALIIFSFLVPLQTYITAILCACAVLGVRIALKERLDTLTEIAQKNASMH